MKKIGVRIVCSRPWPRYAIVDERNQTWWTGNGWSQDRTQAILFAAWNGLAQEYKRLEEEQLQGVPCRDYQCIINVRVWSGGDYSMQALVEYLIAATAVHLDVNEKGAGPVEGSAVRLEINWGTLHEKDKGTQP